MRDTIFVQDYKTTSSKQTRTFYVRKEIKMLVLFRTLFGWMDGWMDGLESIYCIAAIIMNDLLRMFPHVFYKLYSSSSHSACYAWLCSFLKMNARAVLSDLKA